MVARIPPFAGTVVVVGDVGNVVLDVAGDVVVGATVVAGIVVVVDVAADVVVGATVVVGIVVVVEVVGAAASNNMVWQPAVTEVRMPSEATPEPTEKPIPMTVKPRLSRTPCHAAGVPCHADPEPPDVSGALSLST